MFISLLFYKIRIIYNEYDEIRKEFDLPICDTTLLANLFNYTRNTYKTYSSMVDSVLVFFAKAHPDVPKAEGIKTVTWLFDATQRPLTECDANCRTIYAIGIKT